MSCGSVNGNMYMLNTWMPFRDCRNIFLSGVQAAEQSSNVKQMRWADDMKLKGQRLSQQIVSGQGSRQGGEH